MPDRAWFVIDERDKKLVFIGGSKKQCMDELKSHVIVHSSNKVSMSTYLINRGEYTIAPIQFALITHPNITDQISDTSIGVWN